LSASKSLSLQEHILNIASEEFATQGFKGATLISIANKANLPKANVLYHFKSKNNLYIKVLEQILVLWNSSFDKATIEDDPKTVLTDYIVEKMRLARRKPHASKIFAQEIINGAPILKPYLEKEQKHWFEQRVQVIQGWIDIGKMSVIEPRFFLFSIWASCQHYADFSTQITCLLGESMDESQFDTATKTVVQLTLAGCGLD
jgi:TetR/AcrR family transcriptional regulator